MLISFSGLDGAGKSTLINHLKTTLEEKGYHVVILTMYDHISFYAFLRMFRDKILKYNRQKNTGNSGQNGNTDQKGDNWLPDSKGRKPRDPKIGVGDKKNKIEKFVYGIFRSVAARRFMLLFDILNLTVFRLFHEVFCRRVIITDRYIYDTLADVSDLESREWFFVKHFLKIVPEPDLPIFVDVKPETAYARKKEYPVEYMKWRRDVYHKIFNWLNAPFFLNNEDFKESQTRLVSKMNELLYKN